jgi:phosphopentomutase
MRVFLIVLDGVGIGALPDADRYGDAGADTLLHVAEAAGGLTLPTLEALGLGRLVSLPGVLPRADARGAWARMTERSAGKDSTTGHWEMMGVELAQPFPTYPMGFPTSLLDAFSERVGRGWLGNRAASGTEIIQSLGEEHQRSGRYIVYTSADSVFQVAAHVETVPLHELHEACRIARLLLTGPHAVGRVIARPFAGVPGHYTRTSDRRDFSLPPPRDTVLDALSARGVRTVSVGKVDDLFAGRGIQDAVHTKGNPEGQELLLDMAARPGTGLVFANLVDFDTLYGHRNDPLGFARALMEFDEFLGRLVARTREGELILITADHGNDPTTPGTDHSREFVPFLALGRRVRSGADLGTRPTLADIGATIADLFSVASPQTGASMLKELRA